MICRAMRGREGFQLNSALHRAQPVQPVPLLQRTLTTLRRGIRFLLHFVFYKASLCFFSPPFPVPPPWGSDEQVHAVQRMGVLGVLIRRLNSRELNPNFTKGQQESGCSSGRSQAGSVCCLQMAQEVLIQDCWSWSLGYYDQKNNCCVSLLFKTEITKQRMSPVLCLCLCLFWVCF